MTESAPPSRGRAGGSRVRRRLRTYRLRLFLDLAREAQDHSRDDSQAAKQLAPVEFLADPQPRNQDTENRLGKDSEGGNVDRAIADDQKPQAIAHSGANHG